MKSIKDIFVTGKGPSSSHTMGPRKASQKFLAEHTDAAAFRVTLYGSLAATGKGHLTDVAIEEVFEGVAPLEIVWRPQEFLPYHPNAMLFEALDSEGSTTSQQIIYSVGGGSIVCEGQEPDPSDDIYPLTTMSDIMDWCNSTGRTYWEYVFQHEGRDIKDFLREVWNNMRAAVERGINNEGALPGPLHLRRKAASYFIRSRGYKDNLRTQGLLFAYALAVSEENATGGIVVTAPTCGSSGVVPSVLYHLWEEYGFNENQIIHALATAGLVGAVVKTNASVSGAEVGCQGEVGVACAMAAAAASQLMGGSPAQIEYAAEMALEHHLGMTCDPMCGLVQIPCIERNAMAAARALDAQIYSFYTDGAHRVSFDSVVSVMKHTGHDIPSLYKET
ncbi:MAG: L-serine ammonia-lyase, iron-sulfur-dependent, subunit alpha, partial [Tidjanibacter sp.]|nr:L-serine ammonia-lyase, iron-sulfur-dependent, subunit alpha [Tidjanibacter sp.]